MYYCFMSYGFVWWSFSAGVCIIWLVGFFPLLFCGVGIFTCFSKYSTNDSIGRLKAPRLIGCLRLEVTSGDHLNSTALLKGNHMQVVFQYLQGYCTTSPSNGGSINKLLEVFSFAKLEIQFFSNVCPFPLSLHWASDSSVFLPIK